MKKMNTFNQYLAESVLKKNRKEEIIDEFLDYASEYLSIDKPNVEISYDPGLSAKLGSFGYLDTDNGDIVVIGINRNLADILRTIAHELVHTKQLISNKDFNENEANAEAGIIVRKFGLENKYIYE
jgi:Zn-dependent peptidase ImmA (M78 family)